ncbi:hypothetical protein [Paraburkholderia sp.]|uniref:hypothetical protein n=1 Tax=Paraburkholderia sp. TaxID=1926495 RepID=UPI00238C5B86|nr:hypothetical protein [Paraburkholderia sp.]MDE1181849.1 hypothetical protein [Paraburkholderia sp.]
MRRVFNIAVVMLLAYLMTDRLFMHAQAGEPGTVTCRQGAHMVKQDALKKGFGNTASSIQAENFLAGCLVTGRAQFGNVVAHD